MPTITPTWIKTPIDGGGLQIWKWASVSAGDTCLPVIVGRLTDKTVYFLSSGAFGGSFSLVGCPQAEESIAEASRRYVTLSDPNNNALSGISVETAESVQQHAYFIKPVPGAGVSAVDVYLMGNNQAGG